MAVRIQLRRGNNSEFSGSLQLAAGEVALVEDEKVLIVGDGTSTYNDLKAAGKFINYQTDQGLGTVGGANATGETPLTVKGVGSQTAAILKVTDSSDGAILQIFDDEGPTVRLEDHGATNEVFMLLKQQASGTANALELKDSGDTNQMTISCDGEVAITPTNNQTADAPSLDVKGSAATQSNGILRVQASDGSTNLFRVLNDSTNILKASVFGSTPSPDHTDPSFFGQIQTATTPNNTDSGAASDAVIDFPHFKMVSVGSGTQIRGKLELAGNSAAGTFNALAVVKNGATPYVQAEIKYNGDINSEGKGTFADLEVDVSSRTLSSASVPRLDEVINITAPFKYQTDVMTDSNYNGTTLHLLPFDIASAPHDFNSKTTHANQPAMTLVPISGTNASPDTSGEFGTGTGDTTNAHLLKVPANSGPFVLRLVFINGTFNVVGADCKVFSYTAQTAQASDGKTELLSYRCMESAGTTNTRDLYLTNATVDKFIGVAIDGFHNTDNNDNFSYTFTVARDSESLGNTTVTL